MKPIEVGCMVMIISGHRDNIGKVGTVGEHDPCDPEGEWRVDGYGFSGTIDEDLGHVWCTTNQLLRLDGHEPEAVDATADEEIEA